MSASTWSFISNSRQENIDSHTLGVCVLVQSEEAILASVASGGPVDTGQLGTG